MKMNTLQDYPFRADFYEAVLSSNGYENALTYTFVATIDCKVSGRPVGGTLDLISRVVYKQGSQFRNIRDRKGEYVYPVANGAGLAYIVKYVEPILDVFAEVEGYRHQLAVA